MSSVGDKTKDPGTKLIGTVVREVGKIRKVVNILISAIFDCKSPNRSPTQLRGPSPKGNRAIGCRFCLFSSENLSGSNLCGSG